MRFLRVLAVFLAAGPALAQTAELEYHEERGGTLIRGASDRPMPSRGRFTIDPATGRVLASLLVAESATLRARIEVGYALEPAIGGKATYARLRRYQVVVDEKVR